MNLKCKCSHTVASHDDGDCNAMVFLGENQWIRCHCREIVVAVTSNPAVQGWLRSLRRKGKR